MKHIRAFTIALLLVLCTLGLYAQETVPASGSNATGSGGSSSYTVGQILYTTFTGSNGSVSQGVQQPYEISTTVGFERTEIDLFIAAYPNPADHTLILTIGNYVNNKLIYQLYDLSGKLLDSKQIINGSTRIDIHNLPSSAYLLSVMDGDSTLKTFRIVKN